MSCFLYVNDEESTKKVDIDELYHNKQKRDLKQLSIFNKILNRIHTRIKFTGKKQKDETHIWFTVPEYIFGEPIYDKGDCIAYLVTKLEENGFLVKYVHPNTMFVCWSNWVPAYIRNEFKKKTGKLMDEKGMITDKKDDSDPNSGLFNDPRNPTPVKEQKYTPVSKYKPTGNFVYNPDILEKIDKKVSFA